MAHYFEKKKIYTDYFINAVAPTLYHGFRQIYRDAVAMEGEYIEGEKVNPKIKNPGVLKIFQHYVIGLDKWSDSMTENETQRVRHESGCADIFDDLIKVVIKSHIEVLTYNGRKKPCKLIVENLHEKIDPKFLIHSCYLECGRIFVDHPTLFFHDFPNVVLKENERKIYLLIKIGIKNGIMRVLPMRKILTEDLNAEYEEEYEDDYIKIREMMQNKRDQYSPQDEGGRMRLIDSTETSVANHFAELEGGINDNANYDNYITGGDDLETLIYGIKPDDTIDVEILETQNQYNNANNANIIEQQQLQPTLPQNITEQREQMEQIVEFKNTPKYTPGYSPKKENSNNEMNEIDEMEILFGKAAKKGKKSSQAILSDAFNAVKNTDANDDINIVKNISKKSELTPIQSVHSAAHSAAHSAHSTQPNKNNDKFFNEIAKI